LTKLELWIQPRKKSELFPASAGLSSVMAAVPESKMFKKNYLHLTCQLLQQQLIRSAYFVVIRSIYALNVLPEMTSAASHARLVRCQQAVL